MLRKSILFGLLAVVLFTFLAPAEVSAQNKKKKEELIQAALEDASKNKNLPEFNKQLAVVVDVLDFAAKKAGNNKKVFGGKTKEYYGYYKDVKDFLKIAEEHNKARTDAGRAGVLVKTNTKMFDSIDKLAGKGGWGLASYVKAITTCGRVLQNLTLKHLGNILYTDFVAFEDKTSFDVAPYRGIIVELKLADVDAARINQILNALYALDKLN